jgi:outer membrane protein assembly factor BamA
MNGGLCAAAVRRLIGGSVGLFLLSVFFALSGSWCALHASPQHGQSRLASVEFSGSSRFNSEDIGAAVGLHAGANVTRDDLQKAADTLSQLGSFATVKYRYNSDDAGVHAEYQITDAPELPVLFDNFPWFTDEELGAALKNGVHLFDGSAPAAGTILDSMATALDLLLSSRGLRGSVSHALANDPATGQQVQQFHVDGSDAVVSSVEFTDSVAKNSRGVQERLVDLIGKPYSRSAIWLFEVEQVRPTYLANGFLKVDFGQPSARVANRPNDTSSSQVAVSISIQPGPSFVWNGVTFNGDMAISAFDFDNLVQLRRGDPADGTKIDTTWQAVRDAYARKGYLEAKIEPIPHFDAASKQVSYMVAITAGPQYHMGKLVLSGLSVEGERRVRGAWQIPPGSVFDKGEYDQFISSGITQALAGLPFHYEKLGRFLQQNSDSHTVDVLIDFQ